MVDQGECNRIARLEELAEYTTQPDLLWVTVMDPNDKELSSLCQYLSEVTSKNIDIKSLTAVIRDVPPISTKYHRFYDFSALHLPVMIYNPTVMYKPYLILLGARVVITIGDDLPLESINEVEETVRNFIRAGRPVSTSTVTVRILQEIVEMNFRAIKEIVSKATELSGRFIEVDINELLSEITRLRKTLSESYNHLLNQRGIVDIMLQHVPRHLNLSDRRLMALIQASLAELERQQQTLEIQSRAMSDLVSLHSVLLSNRLNKAILTLTSITVITAFITVITNVFGMNATLFNPQPSIIFLGVPVPVWQVEFFLVVISFLIGLIWLVRKGWIRIRLPFET
jgi:Mg2+ and Co2+ transporter CorA